MPKCRIAIESQFSISNAFTAFNCRPIKVHRTDALQCDFLKYQQVALLHWHQLCDEIDGALKTATVAKRCSRIVAPIPMIILIGLFVFVIVYSSITNDDFLFSFELNSVLTILAIVGSAIFRISIEVYLKHQVDNTMTKVSQICNRKSSNIIQYSLEDEPYGRCFKAYSRRYFIIVYTPDENDIDLVIVPAQTLSEMDLDSLELNDIFDDNPHISHASESINEYLPHKSDSVYDNLSKTSESINEYVPHSSGTS
mmetsp:Transcript_4394/g.5718  ORF Transcript_4394/g.5718 Transcript_4394/m.5718 type:complete len:254 (-) Transcript_4394:835-1596(-)